jgi:hypothetical protein
MAKPAITFRSVKGEALSYSELDTNFTNLKDATFGVTVGANTATIDLNSALTLVAGSNITLTLNTSTDTLTIASTASGSLTNVVDDTTPQLGGNLDVNGFKITSNTGTDGTNQASLTLTNGITLLEHSVLQIRGETGPSTGTIVAEGALTLYGGYNSGDSGAIGLDINESQRYVHAFSTAGELTNPDFYFYVGAYDGDGVIHLHPTSTSKRNNMVTVLDGMIIYNTTLGKFQGRAGGSWVDLH